MTNDGCDEHIEQAEYQRERARRAEARVAELEAVLRETEAALTHRWMPSDRAWTDEEVQAGKTLAHLRALFVSPETP